MHTFCVLFCVRDYLKYFFIGVVIFSFTFQPATFQLVGHIESDEGIVLPNIYVQIWEKGEVINQTKTDNFGNYKLILPKKGSFTVMAGNKNKYFHPTILKEALFQELKEYQQDFKLKIDIQILQHETSRLRESYNHMLRNPKNLGYKQAFFSRFPASGYETELFFNKDINYPNLKKESSQYMKIIFNRQLVGWAAYMNKFIKYAQRTEMTVSLKTTQKFYEEAVQIIKDHPLELFSELESSSDKRIKLFFRWLFSGGKFGTSKPLSTFDYISGKFPREYSLMQDAFKEYTEKK